MAITRVNDQAFTAALSTTSNLTLSFNPANTNTLILASAAKYGGVGTTNGITNISQTGATWQKVILVNYGLNNSSSEIWFAPNVSGAGTAITVTFGVSVAVGTIVVAEYSSALQLVLDKKSSNTASSTSPDTGNASPVSALNELYTGMIGQEAGVSFSSPTNGFTIVNNVNAVLSAAYVENITTTGSTADCTVTSASPLVWGGTIATFQQLSDTARPYSQMDTAITRSVRTQYQAFSSPVLPPTAAADKLEWYAPQVIIRKMPQPVTHNNSFTLDLKNVSTQPIFTSEAVSLLRKYEINSY